MIYVVPITLLLGLVGYNGFLATWTDPTDETVAEELAYKSRGYIIGCEISI
jgi:hypothetical protein